MGFKCGIVGLPNVGKSTLFNALTNTQAAESANYPFCTIDPNIGIVSVPDSRISKLAEITKSAKIIPTQLEFVDIAGLVKGASKGEGLGNQFLSHIREVDAIIHLLRCFEDKDITHVDGSIDPLRDEDVINTELILADMESLEKRLPNLQKKAKTGDKELKAQIAIIELVLKLLQEGKPAREFIDDEDKGRAIKKLNLITSKPVLHVCNVEENSAASGNNFTEQVKKIYPDALIISASIEAEVASLDNESDKLEYLSSMGLKETGLSAVIKAGYALLDLITFFTAGPKEARAWTVRKNAKAPEAAGVIHTDFEKGFIKAETVSYEDYVKHSGEQGAREVGKLRIEGKDYIVADGDVMHFRFNN